MVSRVAQMRHTQGLHKWSDSEILLIHAHPDWTAAELAERLGMRVDQVRYARKRYGRRGGGPEWCARCDDRPVWVESPGARRAHMCKGCWLREERMRIAEERESAAVRQMRCKQARREERGERA